MIPFLLFLQIVTLALVIAGAVIAHRMLRRRSGSRLLAFTWEEAEAVLSLMRIADGKAPVAIVSPAPSSFPFLIRVADHIRINRPRKVVVCGNNQVLLSLAAIMNSLEMETSIVAVETTQESARRLRAGLKANGFAHRSTVIVAPISGRKYAGMSAEQRWFDLRGAVGADEMEGADLLVLPIPVPDSPVDRFPAGPELLPLLAPDAHVFAEYDRKHNERALAREWRKTFPDLGIRALRISGRAEELFFLDQKIREFLPEELR